jgi:anti-sigma factor RsiW
MKDFEKLNAQLFPNPEQNQSKDQECLEDTPPPTLGDKEFMARFELLSAYLDGEVTADQSRQVRHWLDTDPQVQKWHHQLTKLQRSVKYTPIPTVAQTTEELSVQVFQKLDRRRNQRLFIVGGALVTAIVVGLVVHLFPGRYSPTSQMAQTNPSISETESDPLMIALNHPVIDIPLPDGEVDKDKN